MPLREFPDSFGRDMARVGHVSQRSLHPIGYYIFKHEVAIIGHARSWTSFTANDVRHTNEEIS